MRTRKVYVRIAVLVLISGLSNAFTLSQLFSNTAQAKTVSSTDIAKGIEVGFWNNTFTNARYVSSSYNVPILAEDDVLNAAVFGPIDKNTFLNFMHQEKFVRYAVQMPLSCVTSDISPCGGGGGGGSGSGGGTASPYFLIQADPTNLAPSPSASALSNLIVGSMNGFRGTVSLVASLSPANGCLTQPLTSFNCPIGTVSPSSVTLSNSSLYGTATLKASIFTTTPAGGYTIDIAGNGGGISYHTYAYINVPFPTDPLFGNQWGLRDLNLPAAWQRSPGTGSRVIAVIDSGVQLDHPDLQTNLWTASGFSDIADGAHGIDLTPSNTGGEPADDYGHGTMVAGVAAAVVSNGVGIAGTANEKLMIVKVCSFDTSSNSEGCPDFYVGEGIKWAVNHGANVINLSNGSPFDQPASHDAVTYAWNHGALIVGSAGNSGNSIVECPACYQEVIAVSALNQSDQLSSFSSFGPKVELSAPGQQILTTCWMNARHTNIPECSPPSPQGFLNQLYGYADGTSFAAPFVSGIAALAWDYNIQQGRSILPNQQVRDALDTYVNSLGPHDHYGFGKPDASALLSNLTSSHSYTLSAQWQSSSSAGTESKAQVWVYDDYTNVALSPFSLVGTSLTFNVMTGDALDVQFVHCFNDGSNSVSLRQVQSSGGPPSGSVPPATPFRWVMGAIPASTDAVYNVVSSC